MAPFDSEARYEIKKRSGNKSELNGREYLPSHLKCGHLNHDKDSPDYNNPENGMRLTIWQECAYHMIHQPRPKDIGLSRENNMRAMKANMYEMIVEHGYTYDETRLLIGEAIGEWEEWKERKKYEFKDDSHIPEVKIEGFEKKEKYKGYIPPAL